MELRDRYTKPVFYQNELEVVLSQVDVSNIQKGAMHKRLSDHELVTINYCGRSRDFASASLPRVEEGKLHAQHLSLSGQAYHFLNEFQFLQFVIPIYCNGKPLETKVTLYVQ